MRSSRIAVTLGSVVALALTAVSSAVTAPAHVSVYFLRGEQLASVPRPGKTALDAMKQLVAGPTPAERKLGFRTYLPAGTRVLSVNVTNDVATVDLNDRFASGSDRASLLARLSQVVRTLTGPQGAKKVQLLMNGGIIAAQFPGISMSRPITFRFLQTPNVAVPQPPSLRLPAPDAAVQDVQQQLIGLGYLLPGTQMAGSGSQHRTRSWPFRSGSASGAPVCSTLGRGRGSRSPRIRRRSAKARQASEPKSCSTAR